MKPGRDHIHLHLLVLILAATAILGELISVPAVSVVIWRTFLAAIGAAFWVTAIRKKSLWPGGRTAGALVGIGALIGLHWILFFEALKVANVSICLAGLATVTLFTAFTEPVFEKRRLRPFEVLVGLLVFGGIAVVAGSLRLDNFTGLLYALASAFLAAVFPLLNRRIVTAGGDPTTMVAWEMAGAFVFSLAVLPAFGKGVPLFAWSGLDGLWILILALVCTVFAHGFHIHLLRTLGAFTMNLAISFEPLYGIIAAALLLGEHHQLTPRFYIGLSTILLANVLHPLCVRMTRKKI